MATEESMSPRSITENTLFYGDNLGILREQVLSVNVDLWGVADLLWAGYKQL
jgi:hypothetical protein